MRDLIKILKALSDSTRLRIILLLLKKDLCVCELTFILKMEQSRISHQLRILKDADLVEDIRDKKWIIYRIPEAAIKNLQFLLDRIKRELKNSKEIREDAARLETCLKEEVRKSNK